MDTADVFDYLDGLRESGETNMFGAAPYVQRQFRASYDDASRLTQGWMRTFSRDKTAAERAAEFDAGEVASE